MILFIPTLYNILACTTILVEAVVNYEGGERYMFLKKGCPSLPANAQPTMTIYMHIYLMHNT